MSYDLIHSAARAELMQPTFQVTRQFLSVLEPELEQGQPVIAATRADEVEAAVFFRVRHQNFFLAIYLDLEPEVRVRSVETESCSFVWLSVKFPDDARHDDWNLPPLPAPIQKRKGGIVLKPDFPEVESAEWKIDRLLEYLEPHADAWRALSRRTTLCLHIAYYGYYGQMWGVHLEAETLRRLADLGLEFDLDLYAGGAALR